MTDIWKPFPKELPKVEGEYLVTIKCSEKYSYVTIRKWSEFYDWNGKRRTTFHFYDEEFGNVAQQGVIAWTELPQPYKED